MADVAPRESDRGVTVFVFVLEDEEALPLFFPLLPPRTRARLASLFVNLFRSPPPSLASAPGWLGAYAAAPCTPRRGETRGRGRTAVHFFDLPKDEEEEEEEDRTALGTLTTLPPLPPLADIRPPRVLLLDAFGTFDPRGENDDIERADPWALPLALPP